MVFFFTGHRAFGCVVRAALLALAFGSAAAWADGTEVVQKTIQRERAACDAYLAAFKTKLQGDAPALGGRGLARFAAESAKVREWLVAEEARLGRLARALEINAGPVPLDGSTHFVSRLRVEMEKALAPPESDGADDFSFDRLRNWANHKLKAAKWLETEEARLQEARKAVVPEKDPPRIRGLLKKLEEALAKDNGVSPEPGRFEEWQSQIEHKITAWESLAQTRQELLVEYRELRKRGITTPEAVDALTTENTRLIEKAAIESFHLENDPSQTERLAQLEKMIQRRWREILLAHDAEWGERFEKSLTKETRYKELEDRCFRLASGAGIFSGALASFLSVAIDHDLHAYTMPIFSTLMIAVGTAGLLAKSGWHFTNKLENLSAERTKASKAILTEDEIRENTVNQITGNKNGCLAAVYQSLLNLTPSMLEGIAEAERLVRVGVAEGTGPQIRVGTGDAAPNPLAYIKDPKVREAAEDRLIELESDQEVEKLLHSPGCAVQ